MKKKDTSKRWAVWGKSQREKQNKKILTIIEYRQYLFFNSRLLKLDVAIFA
jgi:hypothetical protein